MWPEAPWPIDVVQSLVDKSLFRTWTPERLEDEEPRFGMYLSIRAFASDVAHRIPVAAVREKIDAAFGKIPQEAREKILFGNAAELYGVEAPDRKWVPPVES